MIATLCGSWLMAAHVLLGLHPHRSPEAPCVAECGAEEPMVLTTIARLQGCPRWRERERAAQALRRFDWRCHPEAVEALAVALLRDREEEVREEAARSLAKMAPCLPVAHLALNRAAECDPDLWTRHWARKGLRTLSRRCEGACEVCVPPSIDAAAPVAVDPPLVVPGPAPLPGPGGDEPPLLGPEVVPIPDPPAPAQGPSPFSTGSKDGDRGELRTATRSRPRLSIFPFRRPSPGAGRRADLDDR